MKETRRRSHSMGLWTLVALVVANMIGTGLYQTSYYAMSSLGDARWILLVWLAGAVMAFCGAIAYGAMTRRLPLSGGEYLYLSRLVHPSIGFLAGWISLIAGFTGPIAANAILVGKYSLPHAWQDGPWPNLVATAMIALGTLSHAIHFRVGAWSQNLIVIMKVFCLLWFLALAVIFGPEGGWKSGVLDNNPMANVSTAVLVQTMLASLAWVAFCYTGFNAGIYLAGELPKNDLRLPRSMWLATLLVAILYLSLNAVFLYSIPAEHVAGNSEFVAESARVIGGGSLEGLIRLAILLSCATSVLAMLMAGPRVYAQMANDGVLPRLFAARKRIPRRAIVVQGILSAIVVWIAKLPDLLNYLGLTLSTCGALAIACIWWIRRKYPEAEAIRWYEHLCAGIYVLFAVVILVVAYYAQPLHFNACMATFVLGVLLFLGMRYWQRRGAGAVAKSLHP